MFYVYALIFIKWLSFLLLLRQMLPMSVCFERNPEEESRKVPFRNLIFAARGLWEKAPSGVGSSSGHRGLEPFVIIIFDSNNMHSS